MKTFMPCVSLIISLMTPFVWAQESIADFILHYRNGDYFKSAQILNTIDPTTTKSNKFHPWVDYYIAKMRLYGFGLLKNDTLAIQNFTHAAENGLLESRMWLAKYYLNANQPDLAISWFKKAANQNDNDARMMCAAAYTFGYGVSKNLDTARHYIIDAAKNGSALAQYYLAELFLNEPRARNYKLARAWLNKSGQLSLPQAQYKLAEIDIAQENFLQAHQLHTQAIKHGYVPATVLLA